MNVSKSAIAATAGTAIVAYALMRRRDATDDRARASRSVTIRGDAADVQRRFTDPEQLPRFFRTLAGVETLDATHQRWTFENAKPVDVEIVANEAGKRFEWRTAKRAPFAGGGSFTVLPAPGDRGTQVRLALHVDGPGAPTVAAFHRLFGASPGQIAMESLRSFKALVEAGEIPTAASA